MSNQATTFGERVRVARLALGMSLRELARRLGDKAPSYINDIENDRRVPSEPVIRQICEILELDVDEMLAAAGRVGQIPEEYLRTEPKAGVLFRKVVEERLGGSDLDELLKRAEQLAKKRQGSGA